MKRRVILAITGASGAAYGISALAMLRNVAEIETHLIISPAAQRTIGEETDTPVAAIKEMADAVHSYRDIGASLASGSYRTAGMLVAPCSVKTLSGIANAYDDNLVVRAADVCLKERRRVVLMLRETPLHLGHVELIERVTRYGAIVMPPVPAFYHRPTTIQEIVDQSVGRALDLLDIDLDVVRRWTEYTPRSAGGESTDDPDRDNDE